MTSNLSEGRPSASVVIDQAKAAAAGVSPATLSAYLSLVLSGYPLGTVPTAAGDLTAQLTVGQITLPPVPGAVTAMLTRIPVPGSKGMVPLSQIATVTEVKAPVQVTHVDGQRTASITASVTNNNIGAASTSINQAMDNVQLPQGATWELAGATQMTNDVFRTLGIAMLIAILLVYIIMVATFRSLLNPLILLVSIPFAAVGAVLALIVTGTALGMPSLIGLLMLIGIVVTNAIVLLDLVEQFRRQGMDARSAVIEGGRRRLRPILMTAVATILALTPMALGMGKGGFLSTPLAVVVIGGLFTSTLLTLILVPVLYVAFDRLRPKSAYVAEEDARRAARRPRRRLAEKAVQTGASGVPLCGASARRAGGARVTRRKESSVAKPAAKKATRKTSRGARQDGRRRGRRAQGAPRKLTKAQLIDELNKDLAKEYSALIQYVQHASVITGPQYDAISAELTIHSNEEHQHAITLSDQIDFLGGVPAVDVADIQISPDSKVMLEQDLEGELDAIARYRERIAQAEMLQEYGLRRALEDILIVEEEHARDLQSALDL